MDLHELYYKSVTLKNISGEEHKIQISSSYSKWNYSSSNNGYLTEVYDRVSFQIMAASGEPRDFDNEFSGNIAGNFISAGNTSCLKGSSGSAVAEIVGNTLYFNQGLNNRLHFCKYSETLMRYSGQIEYFPVTGIRKITINHPRGNFVGSF